MKMDNNASSGMMLLIEDTNLSCVSMPHRGEMCTAPITPFQSILYIPRGINVIVQHVPFVITTKATL